MNVLVNEDSLKNIADAIRAKNSSTTLYKPGEMAAAIQAIEVGKKNFTVVPVENETITITPAGSGITSSGNNYTLAFNDTIVATVTGDSSYTPGNITVGGVDQGSSSVNLQVADGMVISATEAAKKQTAYVAFIVPAITLVDEGSGNYSYNGTELKDETGAYTIPTYKVNKAADSENVRVNITNPGLESISEVTVVIIQGEKRYGNSALPDADITSQNFEIPAGNIDLTQAFQLGIMLTRMVA